MNDAQFQAQEQVPVPELTEYSPAELKELFKEAGLYDSINAAFTDADSKIGFYFN